MTEAENNWPLAWSYIFSELLIVVLALLLAGCDAVFAPAPLGESTLSLNPGEWQGSWLASDMVVTTTVLDKDKGLLQAAWIERGAEGATLEVVEGYMRISGDMIFANVRDDNENVEPRCFCPGEPINHERMKNEPKSCES
jgi:hypothetical protein